MGLEPSIVLAPYGDHWNGMRRLVGRYFGHGSLQTMYPSIVADDRELLRLLLDNPKEWRGSIR
jgi:hypothetical protein